MNVKELKEQLSITRANIRFYEKEGLLTPQRQNNKYRNYSNEDFARLQKIIVLRKLGVSIPDIKSIFDGGESLQNIIHKQTDILQGQIEELSAALDVCKQIENDKVDIISFNEAHYFDLIKYKESQGQAFVDIYKDYLDFEFKRDKEKLGLKKAFIIVFIIAVIRGLSRHFIWKGSFWDGFLYPFTLFIMASVILLPLYFLNKINPKLASFICKILFILSSIFIGAIIILLIVLLLNSKFHFWF